MKPAWNPEITPNTRPVSALGWLRALVRGAAASFVLVFGLIVLLVLRIVEAPIWAPHRPMTPYVTVMVCKIVLKIIGLQQRVIGSQMQGAGAVVANHSSWLDILVLNARQRVYFVAKSEVSGWPVIGWLARATGTVFVRRMRSDAKIQKTVFEDRLAAGHRLLFFPEGTSTDGSLILSFKSTLYAAFFAQSESGPIQVQPVTVRYRSPQGTFPEFYGWWGDMSLGPHLLQVLAAPRQGVVTVTYHAPLAVMNFADRKELALACEQAVRAGMTSG
ncbi:MAG: lysophospholipid acyltransferase family protein [Paracoccaceae bacterium]